MTFSYKLKDYTYSTITELRDCFRNKEKSLFKDFDHSFFVAKYRGALNYNTMGISGVLLSQKAEKVVYESNIVPEILDIEHFQNIMKSLIFKRAEPGLLRIKTQDDKQDKSVLFASLNSFLLLVKTNKNDFKINEGALNIADFLIDYDNLLINEFGEIPQNSPLKGEYKKHTKLKVNSSLRGSIDGRLPKNFTLSNKDIEKISTLFREACKEEKVENISGKNISAFTIEHAEIIKKQNHSFFNSVKTLKLESNNDKETFEMAIKILHQSRKRPFNKVIIENKNEAVFFVAENDMSL